MVDDDGGLGGSTVSLPDTPWKRALTVAAVDSAQMLTSSSLGCAAESSSRSALCNAKAAVRSIFPSISSSNKSGPPLALPLAAVSTMESSARRLAASLGSERSALLSPFGLRDA